MYCVYVVCVGRCVLPIMCVVCMCRPTWAVGQCTVVARPVHVMCLLSVYVCILRVSV